MTCDIANGQQAGGAIVLGNPGGTAPSYENSYDAAGNVVSVETIGGNSGTDLMAQRFSYDLRGERTKQAKQGSVCTFLCGLRLSWPADFGWPGPPPQLGFDRRPECIECIRVTSASGSGLAL